MAEFRAKNRKKICHMCAGNPVDYKNVETVSVEKDPFESFGESVTITDNDLPF